MSDKLVEQLSRIGIDESKAGELAKNPKVANIIAECAAEAGYPSDKAVQIQNLAQSSRSAKPLGLKNRPLVARAIADGRLVSALQIDAALKYVGSTETPTDADLDKSAGVGITVTKEEVEREINAYVKNHADELRLKRYKALGPTMGAIKKLESLKWANPAFLKPAIDQEFLTLLGPKDERDDPKLQSKLAKKESKKEPAEKSPAAAAVLPERKHNMFEEGFLGALHAPGGNEQVRPEIMQKHLEFTKGRVFSRFPPEPNGTLHVGHAKAIAINFGYAAYHQGECYLRFDDTNPETEDIKYSRSIEEIVSWLGFTPYKVTWSSDYFHELYDLAEKLIGKGEAYVCFCSPDDVRRHRGIKEDGTPGGERSACKHRSQAPEEALQLFRNMRDGKYAKGEATLRMKQDLSNPNPQMWDLVAYRVVNAPHHRTGTTWKIYPTYDFTHCLVDSMENITHSLCSMEFRMSRESYEWLCDAVDVYKPAQREFGKLNLQGSVMSKRKLLKLIDDKYVRDWDDPRLYTLVALRRRGVPPGAILALINELGVTTSVTTIEAARFDASIRKYLEGTVPRLMMVPHPVKVTLTNLPENYCTMIDIPFKPGSPEFGEHAVPFTRTLYIDRSDFRHDATTNFFRLTLNQPVGLLRLPHVIKAVDFKQDSSGKVTEIIAEYDTNGKFGKPKTFIQWVAESPEHQSPVRISEIREFEQLFKSNNPTANPDGFLADINENSEQVLRNGVIDTGFWEVKRRSPWTHKAESKEEKVLEGHDTKGAPEAVRFQALRVGYFCMDRDSAEDKIVLNRIVTLKEDRAKE